MAKQLKTKPDTTIEPLSMVVSKESFTPATETPNDRRLIAAIEYLTKEFRRAEEENLYGQVAVIVPFQNGDAQRIQHESRGQVSVP